MIQMKWKWMFDKTSPPIGINLLWKLKFDYIIWEIMKIEKRTISEMSVVFMNHSCFHFIVVVCCHFLIRANHLLIVFAMSLVFNTIREKYIIFYCKQYIALKYWLVIYWLCTNIWPYLVMSFKPQLYPSKSS